MSSLLFFDPSCQQPYDTGTLLAKASGGTEASLTRIADALGAYVMQHNRTEPSGRYLPPQPLPGIDAVVLNRDARALPRVRMLFPNARFFLWVHDQLRPHSKRGRRLARSAALLEELAVTVVCVSDAQRRGVEATLRHGGAGARARAVTIYNPIDDALAPGPGPPDLNKLVFFSSPNKGLYFALDVFATLRRAMPELRLLVGNPGYKAYRRAPQPGVEFLGALPQARVHAEVRGALCTFCPNFLVPETFGLVFAESHALGTPVLTVDCGAALEVVGDRAQVLPLRRAWRAYEALLNPLPPAWRRGPARLAGAAGLFEDFTARIRTWRAGGRPAVQPDPRFRLAAVSAQWRALLGR
ncbi:MAG: glycosyltransferase family 4 protein [Gammaproteobacteria bacterium]|nr:glycosyltransferase family 4 protein [Gammaproteobacteria bacterium]